MSATATEIQTCRECGASEAPRFIKGLCARCYGREYHSKRLGRVVTPRPVKPAYCAECGGEGTYAKALCLRCYQRISAASYRRRKAAGEGRELKPWGRPLDERFEADRRCPSCDETKSGSEFGWFTHHGRVRPQSHCKVCQNARYARSASEWQRTEAGKARRRARQRAWAHTPEGRRFYRDRARRRRLRGAEPLTVEYAEVLRLDPCSYCGGEAGQVDHIEPVVSGGADSWKNLAAACIRCNSSKQAQSLLRFMAGR